ncbi:MAG: hypothetical protein SGI88_14550 [Candidatus Hydrogenedentes bacterium]|nr:hypothetical protein [Candidatus Hydrogenedentota bacterium]
MVPGQVLYARFENVYVLKFVGSIGFTDQWTFPLSKSVRLFVDRLLGQDDYENIVIDLTECEGMDSTNLGLLAEVGRLSIDRFGRKASILVPETSRMARNLKVTGFESLFTLLDVDTPVRGDLEALREVSDSELNVARMLLEAHKSLSEINEPNRIMFKSVIEAIETDIARMEKEQAEKEAESPEA